MIRNTLIIILLSFAISSCRISDPLPVTAVEPGKFYRSGQVTGEQLELLVRNEGIKTVINLRGAHPGEKWFDDEFNVAEMKQLHFYSLDFELKKIPHRRSLVQLIDIIRTAPRPILIHCDNGVERTGEAAAIYEMVVNGKSKSEAMNMLSKKYYYKESDDPSKKYFINDLWQDESWARNVYNPCIQKYDYYDQNQPECVDQGN